MKKFFFYKKGLQNIESYKEKEFNILSKKLIKLKLSKKQKFSINFFDRLKKKSFCIKTGNKRSINSLFFLSRMSLKENIRSCLLNGVKKISW